MVSISKKKKTCHPFSKFIINSLKPGIDSLPRSFPCPDPFPTLPSTQGNLINGQTARWWIFLIEWLERISPNLAQSSLAHYSGCITETEQSYGSWKERVWQGSSLGWIHKEKVLRGVRARVDGKRVCVNVCVWDDVRYWGAGGRTQQREYWETP